MAKRKTRGRSTLERSPLGQPFAEWTNNRDDLGPFVDLDSDVQKGAVRPDYSQTIMASLTEEGGEPQELQSWVIEDDCQVRSPWGQLFDLDLLPPGVKERAQRCALGSPWRTVRDDLATLSNDLANPNYESCSARLDQLARHSYNRGALAVATGKAPDRSWEAEIDFFGRCVRTRIDRPGIEREELLELDGAALDQRAADLVARGDAVHRRDELIFQRGGRGDLDFSAVRACGNLVHGLLDEAEANGALEAEKAGPNDPPAHGSYSPGRYHRSDLRTLSWCLRPQPAVFETADDAAERFSLLEIEDLPEETRRERASRAGSARSGLIVPPEPTPIPRRSFWEELEISRARGTRRGRADRPDETLPDTDFDQPGTSPRDDDEGVSGARPRSNRRKTKKSPKRRRR